VIQFILSQARYVLAADIIGSMEHTEAGMTMNLAMGDDRTLLGAPTAPSGPALFTWAAWGASLALALVYVGSFGKNVPFRDEWEATVPFLTGEYPLTFERLWAQHSEHRIVLTRLVQVSLMRLGGGDFRVGMYFNVSLCAAIAAALVRAARRLRGRYAYQDAVFPLLLLQVGHYETFLRGDTVGNVLGTALACVLLLIILRGCAATALRRAALAGACLLLLPFCGGNGICLAPAFSAWLVYAAIADLRNRSRGDRLAGLLELGAIVMLYIIIYIYSIGWQKPTWAGTYQGLAPVMRTALEFLTAGLGPAARSGFGSTWPYSGAAVPLLMLLPAGALAAAAWRWREERLRALGLLLFLAAFTSLALGVGYGRAGMGPGIGFFPHYALLATPALCGAYLAWEAYAPRGFAGLVGAAISTLACMCYVPNLYEAWSVGTARRAIMNAFEEDVKAGMPPRKLVQRPHATVIGLYSELPDLLPSRVRTLRSRDINQFRRAHLMPVVPLRIKPAALHDIIWKDGAGKATGHDPYLIYRFPKPQYAWGIRLTCSYEGHMDDPAAFQAFWKLSGRNEFTEGERTAVFTIRENEREIILPIDDVIDSLRIDPDVRPRDFRISRLELIREPDPSLSVLR